MNKYADEMQFKFAMSALIAAGLAVGLALATALSGPGGAGFANGPAFESWSLKLFVMTMAGVCLAMVGTFLIGRMIGFRSGKGEAVQIQPSASHELGAWLRREPRL